MPARTRHRRSTTLRREPLRARSGAATMIRARRGATAPPRRRRAPSLRARTARGARRDRGDRPEHPAARGSRALADVHEHERSRPVRRLRLARARSTPGRTAPPADRPRSPRPARVAPKSSASPTTSASRHDLGQQRRGRRRTARAARRPTRARRCRSSIVRDAFVTSVACTRAAGELPDEPRIDGAERELVRAARRRARAATRASSPRNTDRERAPCARGSARPALAAPLRGSPVLPDDRARDGLPVRAPRAPSSRAGS